MSTARTIGSTSIKNKMKDMKAMEDKKVEVNSIPRDFECQGAPHVLRETYMPYHYHKAMVCKESDGVREYSCNQRGRTIIFTLPSTEPVPKEGDVIMAPSIGDNFLVSGKEFKELFMNRGNVIG